MMKQKEIKEFEKPEVLVVQEPKERLVAVARNGQVFNAPMRDVPTMLKNGWKRVGF